MKNGLLGMTMGWLLAAGTPGYVATAQELLDNAVPSQSAAAPASVEVLKQKFEAINSSPSSPGINEVIKLYQAGVDKGVIETYIRNSNIPGPSPKELIYLHEQKVPEEVVKALIDHGRELKQSTQNPQAVAPQANPGQTDSSYSTGPTYNNYVYNAPSTSPGMSEEPSYSNASTGNGSAIIIPYNPYRNYYNAYYSPPFYSPSWYSYSPYFPSYAPGYPYGYSSYYPDAYCGGPYRYFGPSYSSYGYNFGLRYGPGYGGYGYGWRGPAYGYRSYPYQHGPVGAYHGSAGIHYRR